VAKSAVSHRTEYEPDISQLQRILHDPRISWKAKGILCFLMLNSARINDAPFEYLAKEGSDGDVSIRSGLTELEKSGYLLRLRYRDRKTKNLQGSFWIYTTNPGEFDTSNILSQLHDNGLELADSKSRVGVHDDSYNDGHGRIRTP